MTTQTTEVIVIKQDDKFLTKDFSQSYQIRNTLVTAVPNVGLEIHIPTHYAQKELVQFNSAELILSNGTSLQCIKNNNVKLDTIGRASLVLPTRIDCVNPPGVRCLEVQCAEFDLKSMTDTATLMLNLRFMGDSLNEFQLPDLLGDGFTVGSNAKLLLDETIQDIQPNLVEIFSLTKVFLRISNLEFPRVSQYVSRFPGLPHSYQGVSSGFPVFSLHRI